MDCGRRFMWQCPATVPACHPKGTDFAFAISLTRLAGHPGVDALCRGLPNRGVYTGRDPLRVTLFTAVETEPEAKTGLGRKKSPDDYHELTVGQFLGAPPNLPWVDFIVVIVLRWGSLVLAFFLALALSDPDPGHPVLVALIHIQASLGVWLVPPAGTKSERRIYCRGTDGGACRGGKHKPMPFTRTAAVRPTHAVTVGRKAPQVIPHPNASRGLLRIHRLPLPLA